MRDALLLVPEVRGGRPAADRDQQEVGVDASRRPAMVTLHAVVGLLDASNGLPILKRDAALAERALERLGARLVLGGDQPGQRLDDRHLGAERPPGAGELDADDAAAEHDRATRAPGPASSACSLVITRSPSISSPGSVREYEPVARTTLRPV